MSHAVSWRLEAIATGRAESRLFRRSCGDRVCGLFVSAALLLPAQNSVDCSSNFVREKRRYRVADLHELLRSVAFKKVVVRKGLKAGCFADGQRAALQRVRVNEVVPVLGNVARYGSAWPIPALNPKAISELARRPVCVCRRQIQWKVRSSR